MTILSSEQIEQTLANPTFDDFYQIIELFMKVPEDKLENYFEFISNRIHQIPRWMRIFVVRKNDLYLVNMQTGERKRICALQTLRVLKIIHFAKHIIIDTDHDYAILVRLIEGITSVTVEFNDDEVKRHNVGSFVINLAREDKLEGLYKFPAKMINGWDEAAKELILKNCTHLSIVCNTVHEIKNILRYCKNLRKFEVYTQAPAVAVFALMPPEIEFVSVKRPKLTGRETIDVSQVGNVRVMMASEVEIAGEMKNLRSLRLGSASMRKIIDDGLDVDQQNFLSVELDGANPNLISRMILDPDYHPPPIVLLSWDTEKSLEKTMQNGDSVFSLLDVIVYFLRREEVKVLILPSAIDGRIRFIASVFPQKIICNIPHFFIA